MPKCETCGHNKPDCPSRHANPVVMCYEYNPVSPVVTSTVLTDKELKGIIRDKLQQPHTWRWLTIAQITAVAQDIHTRIKLPEELKAAGWKSTEEVKDILSILKKLVKAFHEYEMDAEGDAPQDHINMMNASKALIAELEEGK